MVTFAQLIAETRTYLVFWQEKEPRLPRVLGTVVIGPAICNPICKIDVERN